ncbi:MAG: TetR/AcrR family transcriptional regulator [Pedobacter sp.]|jgi:TetR/AcrR family transcriptional repressor of mexJK operon
MDNQDKKRQLIIESAVRRFAHFGLSKTTMTEIASDLSMSKALLYYYFPDKISLYSAVLESIINEMDEDLSKGVAKIKSTEKAVLYVLEKRQEYILKYYNILDYIRTAGPDLPENIQKIIENAKSSETRIITSVLQKGIDDGELNINDSQESAALLMDALIGMRYITFSKHKSFQIRQDELDSLLLRQKKLTLVFLKGLR